MRAVLFPLLGLLVACPRGGETDDGPTCEGTPVAIALDEVTPIGVTAADVIARIPPTQEDTFAYVAGTSTPLSLAFTVGDGATFTDLEAVYPPGNHTDIGIVCDDVVTIPLDVAFVTDDGVFDETLSTEVQTTAEDLGNVFAEFDLAAMGGTFAIDDFTDETDYDDARLFLDVRLHDDAVTSGSVGGDVSGQDECDDRDVCSAWNQAVEVGTWGDVEP